MKLGYAFDKNPAALAAHGCERIWLDTPKTERLERSDMLKGLRDGDVIVLLAMSDLARGGERLTILPLIEEKGATIEVIDKAAPKLNGRPPTFAPDPEQDKLLRVLWQDRTLALNHVIRRAREIMGWKVKHHHLRYRYGGRRAAKR